MKNKKVYFVILTIDILIGIATQAMIFRRLSGLYADFNAADQNKLLINFLSTPQTYLNIIIWPIYLILHFIF